MGESEVSRRALRARGEGQRAALLSEHMEGKGENGGGPGSCGGRCGGEQEVGFCHGGAGGRRAPRAFLIAPDPQGEHTG